MNKLKSKEENPDGLYSKYCISKVDKTPINPENIYFILKLEGEGDSIHMEACREAILTYANKIKTHMPKLAQDIQERYS